MNGSAIRLMGAGALAAVLVLGSAPGAAAQGGGGGGAQQPPVPPIVAYRKAMMQSNVQHIAALRALLSGQVKVSDEHIEMHVEALANNGEMFPAMWPEGSTDPSSRAMDEIWTKKDDFAARVKAFADAAKALKDTADKGDNAATLAAVTALNATCGACHMPFRKPPPAAPAAAPAPN